MTIPTTSNEKWDKKSRHRRKFAKNEDKKQIPDQIKNETPLGQKVIGDSKIPVYQDIEGIQMGIPV